MILGFCFPANLEHANSTGRLDLFALYGPVVNYHSVDSCFCKTCVSIAKERLVSVIAEKAASDRKKMGLTSTGANLTGSKLGISSISKGT